ncbi:MAG: hypothetical protein K9J76_10815 [Polaromonas sp.]|nr:hypothetical protein [Polaromonas sp.]
MQTTLLTKMQANTAATQGLASLRNQVESVGSSMGNSLLTLVGFGQTSPLRTAQSLPLMTQVDQAKAQANAPLKQVTSNDPAAKLAILTSAREAMEKVASQSPSVVLALLRG